MGSISFAGCCSGRGIGVPDFQWFNDGPNVYNLYVAPDSVFFQPIDMVVQDSIRWIPDDTIYRFNLRTGGLEFHARSDRFVCVDCDTLGSQEQFADVYIKDSYYVFDVETPPSFKYTRVQILSEHAEFRGQNSRHYLTLVDSGHTRSYWLPFNSCEIGAMSESYALGHSMLLIYMSTDGSYGNHTGYGLLNLDSIVSRYGREMSVPFREEF